MTYLDSPDYYHDLQTESPVGNGNYSCEECVESFDQLYHLKLHEQTHTGESPFQCHVSGWFMIISVLTFFDKKFYQIVNLNTWKRGGFSKTISLGRVHHFCYIFLL